MRFSVRILAGVVALQFISSTPSTAQTSSGNLPELEAARKDAEQAYQEKLRFEKQLELSSQEYGNTYNSMRNTAADYNSTAARLTAKAPEIGMKTDFFNNVVSLRKKDDLDKWVDQKRGEWGAKYGPHIREIDVYKGTEYTRYYDDKGDLMVTKVRGDYDQFKQQADDWNQSYKRAVWAKEKAEKDYNDAVNQYGQLQTLGSKVTDASGRLDSAQRRLNDFLGRQPNSVTDGGNTIDTTGGAGADTTSPAVNLVGRRGRGTFMDGVTPFSVQFQAGGVGTFSTADETFNGTWSVSGNTISMSAGASTFQGSIQGNRISGTVSRSNASSTVSGGRLSDRQAPWDLTLEP
jgi:hypothetical protein